VVTRIDELIRVGAELVEVCGDDSPQAPTSWRTLPRP
jgi:hypothetical protein